MDNRKTKIVCSIGPSCDNDETLRSMILAGMNIARFNFSHGSYEWHKQAMDRVKKISEELNIPVAILLDTKGPEIRTGLTKDNETICINTGDSVELVSDDSICTAQTESAPAHISLSWKEAAAKLRKDVKVLIADGLISLNVEEICGDLIKCRALNSGKISSRKNVNLLGVHAGLPIMSEKDREDLKFGAGQDIDFVAASFVSFADEVVEIKEYLQTLGSEAKVIAKIENEEGLNNIEEIIKEADGVMVARGDLGVQLPIEKIPLAQKKIISSCRKAAKPVITATQMLDSMIINPRPTRAELTDVSNAVFDGTDAVMLSGETASGKYPVESVQTMALITTTAENSPEYRQRMKILDSSYVPSHEVGHVVMHSAYKIARNLGANAIITPTLHGNTARMVAAYRPEQTVIAVTPEKRVRRQLMIHWGVLPYLCDLADDSETMMQNAIKLALDNGAVKLSDKVVLCAGIPLTSPLMANTIKVLVVGSVIARGSTSGYANGKTVKASGRIVHADRFLSYGDRMHLHSKTILVLHRITHNSLPLLRIADGVISETGSDLSDEELSMINKNLVWVLNVPNAQRIENDFSVTVDGEQGLVYEGVI